MVETFIEQVEIPLCCHHFQGKDCMIVFDLLGPILRKAKILKDFRDASFRDIAVISGVVCRYGAVADMASLMEEWITFWPKAERYVLEN